MDKFGRHWYRHWEKLEENWKRIIRPQDLVLLPGDHSWALKLEEAQKDLEFIASLPGVKVLSRGNHDYWWQSLSKIRRAHASSSMHFLQNDSITFGDFTVAGCRGWLIPAASGDPGGEDEKLYAREQERLKLSLEQLDPHKLVRVAMIHYPPLYAHTKDTAFAQLLSQHRVNYCVYGHLHRHSSKQSGFRAFQGIHQGVHYRLVACDQTDFCPVQIYPPAEEV